MSLQLSSNTKSHETGDEAGVAVGCKLGDLEGCLDGEDDDGLEVGEVDGDEEGFIIGTGVGSSVNMEVVGLSDTILGLSLTVPPNIGEGAGVRVFCCSPNIGEGAGVSSGNPKADDVGKGVSTLPPSTGDKV